MLNDNQMKPKNTFVKTYRRDIFGPLLKLPSTRMKLFMVMLAGANYYTEQWKYGGSKYQCEPGQFITSYQKLADACISKDITRKVVINSCKDLIKLNMITVESKYKTNIKITIVNYNGAQFGAQIGAQFESPETTDTIEENGDDETNRAQFGAQIGATNKEVLKNIEEGKGSNDTSPSPNHKKILKEYYQLRQKYTNKPANVNFPRDSKTLDKYNIPTNNADQVIDNLRVWFENADQETINRLYPIGFFSSQYDEVVNITDKQKPKYEYLGDSCPNCRETIMENKHGEKAPHRCKYTGYCSKCNLKYEGEHDCKQYQEMIKRG